MQCVVKFSMTIENNFYTKNFVSFMIMMMTMMVMISFYPQQLHCMVVGDNDDIVLDECMDSLKNEIWVKNLSSASH